MKEGAKETAYRARDVKQEEIANWRGVQLVNPFVGEKTRRGFASNSGPPFLFGHALRRSHAEYPPFAWHIP